VKATDEFRALCELGIVACHARNEPQVTRVLMALLARLDFDYEEAAEECVRLYDTALAEARRGSFGPALRAFHVLAEA
jgi:hypothetical protein